MASDSWLSMEVLDAQSYLVETSADFLKRVDVLVCVKGEQSHACLRPAQPDLAQLMSQMAAVLKLHACYAK